MSAPMTGAARIADFAAATFADGVPDHVLEAAQLHLLDAIGVGLASASLP